MRSVFFLIVLIVLGFVLRIWLVGVLQWNSLNGDEAVAGLMAKHISEGREFPIFFYGQAYFGALESYLTAMLFRLVGFNPILIFVFPLLFALGVVWIEFKLVQDLWGTETALASAALIALAPALYLSGTLSAAGGFGLAVLLQIIAIWLFSRLYFSETSQSNVFLGFWAISGLLFWVWQLYIPLFAFLILLLIAKHPKLGLGIWLLGVALFCVTSSPLWLYNIDHEGATFVQVFGKFSAADTNSNLLSFIKTFIGNRIWNLRAYGEAWLASPSGGNYLVLAVIIAGLVLSIREINLSWRPRVTLSPTLFFIVIGMFVFVLGHRSPRYLYLLPLLLIPIGLAGLKRIPYWKIIVGIAVLTNLLTVWQTVTSTPPAVGWYALIERLDSNSLKYGYGDFWSAYPVTFLTGERIIVAPTITTADFNRTDRYPSYTRMVNQSATAFALVPVGSPDEKKILALWNSSDRSGDSRPLYFNGFNLYAPVQPQEPLRRWLIEQSGH